MSDSLTARQRLKIKSRETARDVVDEREGRDECHACGATDSVEVHHRDGDWLNNHPLNLTPLCHRCHRLVHRWKRSREQRREMRQEFVSLVEGG